MFDSSKAFSVLHVKKDFYFSASHKIDIKAILFFSKQHTGHRYTKTFAWDSNSDWRMEIWLVCWFTSVMVAILYMFLHLKSFNENFKLNWVVWDFLFE